VIRIVTIDGWFVRLSPIYDDNPIAVALLSVCIYIIINIIFFSALIALFLELTTVLRKKEEIEKRKKEDLTGEAKLLHFKKVNFF
jgi:hypothetical protein